MRGPTLEDHKLFDAASLARIREAAIDLRYLLGRGYARKSAIALVGDRAQLHKRQRQLLMRAIFIRDLSEVHGAYRENDSTTVALELLRAELAVLRPAVLEIHLDRPIAFSARFADRLRAHFAVLAPDTKIIVELADSADGALKVRMDALRTGDAPLAKSPDPDRAAVRTAVVLASGDGALLRQAPAVFDVVGLLVRRSRVAAAWVLAF